MIEIREKNKNNVSYSYPSIDSYKSMRTLTPFATYQVSIKVCTTIFNLQYQLVLLSEYDLTLVDDEMTK